MNRINSECSILNVIHKCKCERIKNIITVSRNNLLEYSITVRTERMTVESSLKDILKYCLVAGSDIKKIIYAHCKHTPF